MRSAAVVGLLSVILILTAPALAQGPSHKPGGFHSPEIHKDRSWSHVFNATGISHYHCHPHPFMLGKVEVKEGATTNPVAIEIRGFKFVPDAIIIGVGTNVTWTNRDPSFHTVDESAEGPSSKSLSGDSPSVAVALVLLLVGAAALFRSHHR